MKKFLQKSETNIQNPKYKIKFVEVAEYELNEIYDYIYWRLASPINAKKFIEKLYCKLEYLKFNPYIYSNLSFSNLEYEYRKILFNNFLIVYCINEKEKTVYIMHIFYAKSSFGYRLF